MSKGVQAEGAYQVPNSRFVELLDLEGSTSFDHDSHGRVEFLGVAIGEGDLVPQGPSKLSLMGGFCHEGRQRCGSRPAERQLRPIPREPAAARRHLANYRTRDDIGAIGEFDWSSQHLECGGVRWAGLRDG